MGRVIEECFAGELDLRKASARAYFELLEAPTKEWVDVPRAGHMTRGDRPDIVEGRIIEVAEGAALP